MEKKEIKRRRDTYGKESRSPATVPITTGTIYFHAKNIMFIKILK